MTGPICVRCTRPLADGAYVCTACTKTIERALTGDDRHNEYRPGLIETAEAAADVANGLSRPQSAQGGPGVPESRVPLDIASTAKYDGVKRVLTNIVDHIGTERGITRPWFTHHGDPIATAAQWLTDQLDWMRHHQLGDTWFTDIEAAARIIRGIVRIRPKAKYLGPCGAELVEDTTETVGDGGPDIRTLHEYECTGDVYGRVGAQTGACRTCGAVVDQDERRAWLDGEVRGHAFRAAHIADAYGLSDDTIRTWASRPRPDTGEPPLASYWRTETGLITPWTEIELDPALKGEERAEREAEIKAALKARGPRLHYIGDVLDLAAADAARRETERSKRERRAAARAATTEGDAA